MKNEIVLFTDGDINLEVKLSPELETVWLTQKQMGELFGVMRADDGVFDYGFVAIFDEKSQTIQNI